MKPTPYLKTCLKELDKSLRRLSRQDKLEALRKYKIGLEYSFWRNYNDKFPKPVVEFKVLRKLYMGHYFEKGKYIGFQSGPLEVDATREYLFAEIEKRKTKFSKPSFLGELYGAFGRFREDKFLK